MLGAVLSSAYDKNIAETASKFTGGIKDALEGSLASALNAAQHLGPAADTVARAAKEAWMGGLSTASITAAIIIFISALIAFFALPKHSEKQSDTI